MWPVCSDANILWGLVPLLIGLITGWWAWARRGAPTADIVSNSEPDDIVAVGASAAMVAPETLAKVNAPDRVPQSAPEPDAVILPFADTAEIGTAAVGVAGVDTARGAVPALTAIGVPAAKGPADDLLKIKGVGPKLNMLLTSLGISRFDQIAAWNADDIEKVDAHLGNFKNRIVRDNWVEQAELLATGRIADFEAKFGKLDGENR